MSSTGSRQRPRMQIANVAVLGGTGLIGRHVVAALAAAGTGEIVASYRARPPFEARGVQWKQADLLDLAEARAVLAGVKVAIVCAGKVSTSAELRRDPMASVMDTLRIGINALEAAARERV